MFDFVRKHTKLIQLVMLPMIFVSFVFVGIEGYTRFTDGANASVATVAGSDINQAEWDAAHRQQVERLRRQMPNVDTKLLDSPELKRETLEQLLRERVMLVTANKLNLVTVNERLQRQFATDPQYAMLRNPDGSVRKEVLQAQGMTSEQFAERLRQDLALRQVLGGVTGTALPAQTAVDAALDALAQQREVQVQRFAAADFRAKVNPTEAEVAAYYGDPAHRDEFMAPETATIEYLVLDLDAIKRDIKPGEEELRKYYAENEARYTAPAERRASHILVAVDASASADDKAKAKAEAQSVYEQVKKSPGSFVELAKKHSDDPGSAAKGGDLDFFGRGAMVKPFEDAVFALKPGEVAPLVETDFGYHVIRLDAVRGGDKKGFDAVRAQIENEVKEQLAKQRYAEAAEQFSNLVYEQSDTLQPAADRLKLQVRNATVLRTPAADAKGALASDKFLSALFAPDTLTSKRNTEAVETGANQLAAGRVVKHAPARQLPLETVKDRVREALVREQSAALARKEGEARLAALAGGADASTLPAALKLSRASVGELAPAVVESALKADATKLPALLGVPLGNDGFAVVRVTKVLGRDPTVVDPAQALTQYAQAWSDAEAQAYYAALKMRYAATITAPAAASAPP
jgi:peptidyl-prolyl cis-trans isomerase D